MYTYIYVEGGHRSERLQEWRSFVTIVYTHVHIYVYIHVYMITYIYIYTYISIYLYICMYIYLYIYIYLLCVYACVCVTESVWMYVPVWIIFVGLCIYMYMIIHWYYATSGRTHRQRRRTKVFHRHPQDRRGDSVRWPILFAGALHSALAPQTSSTRSKCPFGCGQSPTRCGSQAADHCRTSVSQTESVVVTNVVVCIQMCVCVCTWRNVCVCSCVFVRRCLLVYTRVNSSARVQTGFSLRHVRHVVAHLH